MLLPVYVSAHNLQFQNLKVAVAEIFCALFSESLSPELKSARLCQPASSILVIVGRMCFPSLVRDKRFIYRFKAACSLSLARTLVGQSALQKVRPLCRRTTTRKENLPLA